MFNKFFFKFIFLSFWLVSFNVHADRIRDLITIQGIRYHQLIGYGLVVGLDGTGDQTNQIPYTTHTLKNMLSQLGISFSNEKNTKFKNIAAVIVTAKCPSFIRTGQQIDVSVSSIGDAKSLTGGILLMTPLKGTDNKIYAIAQGNILINETGRFEPFFQKYNKNNNHFNSGIIVNGATIERDINSNFGISKTLILQLNNENFTLAQEISDKINEFYPKSALAIDSKTVQIHAPNNNIKQVEMLSTIQNININTPIQDAKVIINTKTGDIIINQEVKIDSCIITHKNISITISNNKLKNKNISLNTPLTQSEINYKKQNTETYNNTNSKNSIYYLEKPANLNNIICSLNSLGIKTTELISILQSMRDAGCLHAKLEIR